MSMVRGKAGHSGNFYLSANNLREPIVTRSTFYFPVEIGKVKTDDPYCHSSFTVTQQKQKHQLSHSTQPYSFCPYPGQLHHQPTGNPSPSCQFLIRNEMLPLLYDGTAFFHNFIAYMQAYKVCLELYIVFSLSFFS